jgi:hypothetical protein
VGSERGGALKIDPAFESECIALEGLAAEDVPAEIISTDANRKRAGCWSQSLERETAGQGINLFQRIIDGMAMSTTAEF